MKALYKCDFCSTTGTQEEIYRHEAHCNHNPNRMTCSCCENGKIIFKDKNIIYKCKYKDIPEGKQYINCDKFTLKKLPDGSIENIFSSFFSGGD